jgi:hypothetical protein
VQRSDKVLTALKNVPTKKLGGRAALLYRFLKEEAEYAAAVARLNAVVLEPLRNAANGANLIVPGLEQVRREKMK